MTKKEIMIKNLKGNSIVQSEEWVEENDPIIIEEIKNKYPNIKPKEFWELLEYKFEDNFVHIILDRHRYRQYAFDLIVKYDKISLEQFELYFSCIPQKMNYYKEVN